MSRIGTLIANARDPFYSLEFFPPADKAQLPDFYANVERLRALSPLFVSVTYGAGGAKQDNTLAITGELVRRGFVVMAHLTCVGATAERIVCFLRDLKSVGANNILALQIHHRFHAVSCILPGNFSRLLFDDHIGLDAGS